jgi:uncharacterized protein YbjQ (UPF0145 family)
VTTSQPSPSQHNRPGGAGRHLDGLPPAGRRRLGNLQSGAPWSSHQAVGAEATLRDLGFEPAGVVTGSVYSYGFPYRNPAGYKPRTHNGSGAYTTSVIDDPMSAKRSGGYVHDWSISRDGQPVTDLGWTWEKMVSQHRERRIANEAIAHLVQETRAIGAHGVVGIRISLHGMGADATGSSVYEFSVLGTALRVPGHGAVDAPFTTHLTATDVAKAIAHGYAPSSFHVGISVVSSQLGATSRRRLRSMSNGEVEQYSEVTEKSLELARRDLERTSFSSGSVALTTRPLIQIHHAAGTTYQATVRLPGSVLRPFRHSGVEAGLSYLPIVRLNDRP